MCTCTAYPFGYESVYLPLSEVADTPFHIQEDNILTGLFVTGLVHEGCNCC